MKRTKRFFRVVVACLLTVFTLLSYLPVKNASAKVVVPEIEFASPPVTEYMVGDRISFNIHAPNYGGRVQYRVVLWNDSEKTYYDLWNAYNGYPDRYYTKWQPNGNSIFTLGWIINEPGTYRITVDAKRAGIANNKTALKGYNCDSYMQSIPFFVKSKEATVNSILPLSDVTVVQGATPTLPTKVRAAMSDGLTKELAVTWPTINTSTPGIQTIQGVVEGTTEKATVRVNVTAQTAINVSSIVSVNNYLVNVTLRDAIYATPDASKFSIRSYNSSITTVPIQSISLSADKKTVTLTTSYMTTNSWYTLTVNNNSYNFIANQGTGTGTGSSISIAAQNMQVNVGGTAYAAVAKYPSDTTLTYYSSNTTIATVDLTTGLITGKYPGVATITVYGNKYGYLQAMTTFTVTVGGQSGTYVYAPDMQIGVGSQQTPTVTKNPTDLTVTYTSSNPNIASVNYYTGMVTGVSQGIAVITMTASKSGYTTIYSTFNVTVIGQAMTVTATPVRLYEALNNNGTLQSGVIDVILTGGTFYNWSSYYQEYVDINNLPFGMSYTVAYVSSNMLRVTITGAAYMNRDADDATINITINKELVYGASYNLTTNNLVLDFTDYPTPTAPTNPNVDDINNTFGWTNASGYTSISDYEYRVKTGSTWGTWTTCTANPQTVGDIDIAVGGVEVRVKQATGRNAGVALASTRVFTKIADITSPVLGQALTVKFKDDATTYSYSLNSLNNEYIVPVEVEKELVEMNLSVTEANPNTQDVPVFIWGTTNQWGVFKYNQNGIWRLAPSNPIQIRESVRLTATFRDTSNNVVTAVIKIEVGSIEDITSEVVQGQPYTMPATVKVKMSANTEKDVNVNWDRTIYTYQAGIFEALGTVVGYTPKVKLTVKVIPLAPTNPVIDDINNTFDWTYVQSLYNVTDYEYSVDNGATWADCTVKPQQLYNVEYPVGYVQVRIKYSDSPARPTGIPLKSDKAYTKDTPIDDKAPELGNLVITFEDADAETYSFVNRNVYLDISIGDVLNTMTIQVSDTNLETRDRIIYQFNTSGGLERAWGTLKYNGNTNLWELIVASPSQFIFDVQRTIKLYTEFDDTLGNSTHIYININVTQPV